MKVGWLVDRPKVIGGAELTAAEFELAAPDGVEIVECRPGSVVAGLDRYVVHNCASYSLSDLWPIGMAFVPIIRYVNDMWPEGDEDLRFELLRTARLIFTSPLHLDKFPWPVPEDEPHTLIPPAVALDSFRASENGTRGGNVCIGRMSYGKGAEQLAAYTEPVDVYSPVPVQTVGSMTYRGALDYPDVAKTLAHYRRFVFLPTAVEPFGRGVVEAWASGCELVVNRNVGAAYWIENAPLMLDSAGADFWEYVCA